MIICASCGGENQAGARFCNDCGAALATTASQREVRKTVTVVFSDVTGSTALGESTDPEALRALLARYFERMETIVESHGGTVEKFIGDAVMAVFGIPLAHEDDALRACRAAVEMRDALPELGADMIPTPDKPPFRGGPREKHRHETFDAPPLCRRRPLELERVSDGAREAVCQDMAERVLSGHDGRPRQPVAKVDGRDGVASLMDRDAFESGLPRVIHVLIVGT